MKTTFLASVIAAVTYLAAPVAGHGYVSEATIGGVKYTGYLPYSDPYYNPPNKRIFRKIEGNGPIEDVSLIDVQCGGWQGSGSAPAALTAPAPAGSTVTLQWTQWPDSHRGPVSTYLAKCPGDCSTYNPGTDAVWFKIAHEGKRADGTWASDDFIYNKPYNFKIPASLAPGNYIVRHELIALHAAWTYPGIQVYPSCFQISVTGSGSATGPSSKVAFPGAYNGSSPGIVYDVYQGTGPYTIPGPAVWQG